jgi:hypothetical protein
MPDSVGSQLEVITFCGVEEQADKSRVANKYLTIPINFLRSRVFEFDSIGISVP